MTQIPAIDASRIVSPKSATYNGVKIVVNNPQVNSSGNCTKECRSNETYNAVSVQVNNPRVNEGHKHNPKCIYEYPCSDCAITSENALSQILQTKPTMQPTYQTTNFINNRTLINAELEIENVSKNPKGSKSELVIKKEAIITPKPNLTTTDTEKTPTFHGINFKADKKMEPQIIPPVEIKPDVDVPNVLSNLSSSNYDIQAQQMETIARESMKDPQKAVPYIVTEIFTELENIVKNDTSKLAPPSSKQIETRKQIIINEIVKEQAKVKNNNSEKIELPYKISEKDLQDATALSPMEQAERNKEYALYTMAILAKVYTDEVHRHTGNVVPLTDLAGVSSMVESLKNDNNPSVKIASIDALRYINRPEYKEEISSILEIAASDSNPYVSKNATIALDNIK